ncbi:hypothetical protein Mapa_012707 [Marchantia paleacea]|nr:hypothetical protein Mapa_012707 [Marchantia paleacea]
MASSSPKWILTAVLVIGITETVSTAQLQVTTDFYDSTCPQAASIVQKKVDAFVEANRGLAASLMRLHFHDSFVRYFWGGSMGLPPLHMKSTAAYLNREIISPSLSKPWPKSDSIPKT